MLASGLQREFSVAARALHKTLREQTGHGIMLACFLACCCACLPCLVVLSLQPQPLLERVVFTIFATMAMGGQASAEEYTPTLEAEGSERNIEVPSSPRSPGEVANEEAPSLRTPDFSPPSGFGPAAQNAVPRPPAASNQDVPAASNQNVPAATDQNVPAASGQAVPAASDQNVPAASDQNVPAASGQDVTVALIQDAMGAVPDLAFASPAETEDLDSWGPQWPGDGPSSKKSRVSPGIPRQGIPSNVAAGSVVPGATALNLSVGEQLLIRALREESERRWREVVQIGGLAPPSHEADEPRPLLSHYYGVPPVEQMYDSVAMLGVPGFLLRTLSNPAGLLAGNVGVGGAHGTAGQERLPFPSEMDEETPPIRPALRPPQERAGPPALRWAGLVRQARVRLFARGGRGPVAALQVEPRRHSARRPAVSRAGPAAHGAQLARGRGALRQAGHQQPRGFVRSKPRISVFHEDLKPSGGWGGLQLAPDVHGCGREDALGPRLCDGAALEQQLSARS